MRFYFGILCTLCLISSFTNAQYFTIEEQMYHYKTGDQISLSVVNNVDSIFYGATNIPDNASFNRNTGEFFWTVQDNQAGIYSVIFQATDSTNALLEEKVVVFDIAMGNQPPEIHLKELLLNGELTSASSGKIQIKERDTLNMVILVSDNNINFISYYFNGDINQKQLEHADIYIVPETGQIEFKLIADDKLAKKGKFIFTVTAIDEAGLTQKKDFRVWVNDINFPPRISNKPLSKKSVSDDFELIYTPDVINDDDAHLSWEFDYDSERIKNLQTYNNGGIKWQIKSNEMQEGTESYLINIKVYETKAPKLQDSVTLYINWTETNKPPVLGLLPKWEVVEGKPATYKITAEDPNLSDQINYSIESGVVPKELKIDGKTGFIQFDPSFDLVMSGKERREINLMLKVEDEKGLADKGMLSIIVFDRYKPSALKARYSNHMEELVAMKINVNEVAGNLTQISYLLRKRERIRNIVLSSITMLGAASAVSPDFTLYGKFGLIIAGVPAGFTFIKEIASKEKSEIDQLRKQALELNALLEYRYSQLRVYEGYTDEQLVDDKEFISLFDYLTNPEKLKELYAKSHAIATQYQTVIQDKKIKQMLEKMEKK